MSAVESLAQRRLNTFQLLIRPSWRFISGSILYYVFGSVGRRQRSGFFILALVHLIKCLWVFADRLLRPEVFFSSGKTLQSRHIGWCLGVSRPLWWNLLGENNIWKWNYNIFVLFLLHETAHNFLRSLGRCSYTQVFGGCLWVTWRIYVHLFVTAFWTVHTDRKCWTSLAVYFEP